MKNKKRIEKLIQIQKKESNEKIKDFTVKEVLEEIKGFFLHNKDKINEQLDNLTGPIICDFEKKKFSYPQQANELISLINNFYEKLKKYGITINKISIEKGITIEGKLGLKVFSKMASHFLFNSHEKTNLKKFFSDHGYEIEDSISIFTTGFVINIQFKKP